jgi:methylated-DNA-[protein]-cysteine S-methyltransferase
MLFYKNIETPIGMIYLFCEEQYLVRIDFDEDYLAANREAVVMEPEHPLCQSAEKQLMEYFQGVRSEFTVPMKVKGTDFQMQVWDALNGIEYGQVKSYQDIAVQINKPLAVRAIGQANRRNPIPIIIPCHRVIGKNKGLVGYAGDKVGIKEQLLKLEGVLN